MEDINISRWLFDLYNYGGWGNNGGNGAGCGDGSGSPGGYGHGEGLTDGSGSLRGTGVGVGYGEGGGTRCYTGGGGGRSCGIGLDNGSGRGGGHSDSIKEINGEKISMIDGSPTILRQIHGNVAKGAILKIDFTLETCYVVKGSGFFAHGKTLREAMTALSDKILEDAPEEERIAAFVSAHPEYTKPYPNQDLFDWHHRLTGSCEMGRRSFLADHGLTLDGETTVEAFVELTKSAYGDSIIRQLPAAYGEPNP